MTDTPEYIKKKQLEIWLAKPPGERLYRFLKDNDEFYKAIDKIKDNLNSNIDKQISVKAGQ